MQDNSAMQEPSETVTSDRKRAKLPRRAFLGTLAAAGAAAGLRLAPGSYGRVLGASERFVIGHIGVGGRGTSLLGMTLGIPEFEVAALRDVDANHLARAAKMAAGAVTYNDFRKILDRRDIDAVVVATPDHWHCIITRLAVQAGKDVYCEKPLSQNLVEGRRLVDAVRKHRRVVQVGTHHRAEAQIREVAALVRSGRIGKVHTVELTHPSNRFEPVTPNRPPPKELDWNEWLGPAPLVPYHPKRCHFNFRFFYDYAGGYLTDNGVHMINVVTLAMNNDLSGPVAVEGHQAPYAKKNLFECPEKQYVTWTFKNPDFTMTWRIPSKEGGLGMRFVGTTGTLAARFGSQQVLRDGKVVEEPKAGIRPGDVTLPPVPGGNLGDWIRAMRSRKRPINDVEIGHHNVSISHVGNIASRLGRSLRFDPEAETFEGDAEASAMLSRADRPPWNATG